MIESKYFPMLQTYRFHIGDHMFPLLSRSAAEAIEAADCKVREDKLTNAVSFTWTPTGYGNFRLIPTS